MPSEEFLLREWMQSQCVARGYAWFKGGKRHRAYDLNIIGIRSHPGAPNAFDDWLTVSYISEHGQWQTKKWKCTTDPGTYWLENPTKVLGTAVLKPGQYRGVWQVGKHKGKYPALVQSGAPITVWRDNDRDAEADYDVNKWESGFFGINCHARDANPFDANDPKHGGLVNRWSAGCQVFANSSDYREFWDIVTLASGIWGTRFTYTLLDDVTEL